ncbi:general secretion pathway protein GspB [uncultured Halovibrio sp.]|jgi:general secretion pathway protein B|uniref:general secretion pathway protein GspB n=1 Tax=uncultured Halovibrio sp. TaxID=985049 RepID=UPI0025E0A79A|nr:general secretion pathway protein GspB [uncultured Halovibrio sp.]
MSYILDALKKSEAERSNTEPGEAGHRVSFASTPGKQRELWPYLLALALMANAAVVAYLVWPEYAPEDEAAVPEHVAPVQSPRPAEETTAEQPTKSAMESTAPSSGAPDQNPPDNDSSPDRTADAPEEEVPSIHDMPRSVQQRVPEMTFNGHVWSSRASSRSVMINNRLLREGARFQGLVIEKITTAGVVFRLDGHVFEIDIVRDWQGGS